MKRSKARLVTILFVLSLSVYQIYAIDSSSRSESKGFIVDKPALMKNRTKLANSRKPGSDCYGVSVCRVYVKIPSGGAMKDQPPWKEALKAGVPGSVESISEWILQKYPQAEIKILLNECVNLTPGNRCRDFNGIGTVPIIGSMWKFIGRDSPIKPSAIIFIDESGSIKYYGIAVNRYREDIQLAYNMRDNFEQITDYQMNWGIRRLPSKADLKESRKFGGSWGGIYMKENISVEQSGFFESVKLIEADPDYITLYPGELLDVSKPPFMSIISK